MAKPKMRTILRTLQLTLALALAFVASNPCAAQFPLKIGSDGKRIVDQNNEPYFINGDAPWSLIGQVSREDAELYIQDCAEKGINSLIVTLVEGFYADRAPENFYGVQPFLTPGKFSTPNDAYFDHADWIINKAAEHEIMVIIAPNYLGCCDDGWLADLMSNNDEQDARLYGEWIGNRYRNFPNIMYVWGNDLNPDGVRSKIRAMAEGVKATDPNHLHTYHPSAGYSALDVWDTGESWLDINVTYTYEPVQDKVLEDYNRTPFLPFFLFESQYENDFLNASALQTRKQAYVAVLSGANGHHYGNNPIWHMNAKLDDNSSSWKNHLDSEGRADLIHVRRLFESRDWANLIPDQNNSVLTGGIGSGGDYAAAAVTTDSTTAIVYIPFQKLVTIDLDGIAGSTKKAWWFNPRNGEATEEQLADSSGERSFRPPGSEDWLLVIDNATANLPAPGATTLTKRPSPPIDLRSEQ